MEKYIISSWVNQSYKRKRRKTMKKVTESISEFVDSSTAMCHGAAGKYRAGGGKRAAERSIDDKYLL